MLPALYALTLFAAATLLFLVQPLVGKLLLPLVGGTPGVWNACMVFFQALLLLGYAYAHKSTACFGVRRQAALHLLCLLLVVVAFQVAMSRAGSPVPVVSSLVPADQDYPIFGVVALLAAAVGVPFFVLSTTSPLLQRWFAATGHPAARDPYFLYAASNAGSLLGLLLYPLLIEPRFTVAVQQWAWAGGVVLYLLLVLACAACLFRDTERRAAAGVTARAKVPEREAVAAGEPNPPAPFPKKEGGASGSESSGTDVGLPASCSPPLLGEGPGERLNPQPSANGYAPAPSRNGHAPAGELDPPPAHHPKPGLRRVLGWVALSALPSSLLLGVTTHLTTDLAPVPLLWVVPLALYLLSFILVFAHWPDRLHRVVGRVTPMLVVFVALTLLTRASEPLGLIAGLHLLAFFGVALVCHGELARDRPPAEHLTRFYFWMSVGGVVGGVCNALFAPVLFHKVGMVEYPLALVLAVLVRPRAAHPVTGPRVRWDDFAWAGGLLAVAVGLVLVVPRFVPLPADPDAADALLARVLRGGLMFGVPAAVAFALVWRPVRYALALAAIFLAGSLDEGYLGTTLHMERNFFGVVRVTRSPDGKFTRLIHGTTLHGQQRVDEPRDPSDPPGAPPRAKPLAYYHRKGPVGALFKVMPPERVRRVGVVGLGTGAIAYYAWPMQDWTFFEIDPAVKRIAEDPQYFRFLSECRAERCDVALGDARRELSRVSADGTPRFPDGHFDLLLLDAFSSDAIPVHLLTKEALDLYFAKLAVRTPERDGGLLAMHVSNAHLDLAPLVARMAANHDPPLSVWGVDDTPTDADRADGKARSHWLVLGRSPSDLTAMNKARTPTVVWSPVRPPGPGPVWTDDFTNVLGVWKKRDDE